MPCGIADRGVTSLARLLGRPVDRDEVEDRIVAHFCEVFDRDPVIASHAQPEPRGDDRRRWSDRSTLTRIALSLSLLIMLGTRGLPASALPVAAGLLPVHFNRERRCRTAGSTRRWRACCCRCFVQMALAADASARSALLLLSRPHGELDRGRTRRSRGRGRGRSRRADRADLGGVPGLCGVRAGRDVDSASAPASASCTRSSRSPGVVADGRRGRPRARPTGPARRRGRSCAEHWRFGQLYKNADDPALFVPTRDGSPLDAQLRPAGRGRAAGHHPRVGVSAPPSFSRLLDRVTRLLVRRVTAT